VVLTLNLTGEPMIYEFRFIRTLPQGGTELITKSTRELAESDSAAFKQATDRYGKLAWPEDADAVEVWKDNKCLGTWRVGQDKPTS
jgi:hypothetical protein